MYYIKCNVPCPLSHDTVFFPMDYLVLDSIFKHKSSLVYWAYQLTLKGPLLKILKDHFSKSFISLPMLFRCLILLDSKCRHDVTISQFEHVSCSGETGNKSERQVSHERGINSAGYFLSNTII